MTKQSRRRATVAISKPMVLARAPLTIRGYSKSGKFVCRLEISGAGVKMHAGGKGGKWICNLTWEGLVANLSDQR